MAMDFWEAQRRARKKTVIYLVIFIAMTLAIAVVAEIVYQQFNPSPVPYVGPLFLLMTLGVAGFQYLIFRSSGGSYVAESVGGVQISPNTQNAAERQLLNIVEEMAIAASIPVPPVYVIPAGQINAFAAGTSPNKAAIAVTRGSIEQLNRDELQGVIAHEFGHIHNGDMTVSLRLAAMVMGFFFVLYIALRILQFSGLTGGGRSRSDKKSGNPIALVALILLAAGAVAWLFGSILKASVSREREYLADANAVQFTRNPEGIAGALRKIANEETKDMPKSGMAFSHMYLDSHRSLDSLFATHPPLKKRIDIIEGKVEK